MVVSKRCEGFDLLNHIRQKNIYNTINIEYKQLNELDDNIQDKYYLQGHNKMNWFTTLTLDKDTYTAVNSSKRISLLDNINQAKSNIYKKIFN